MKLIYPVAIIGIPVAALLTNVAATQSEFSLQGLNTQVQAHEVRLNNAEANIAQLQQAVKVTPPPQQPVPVASPTPGNPPAVEPVAQPAPTQPANANPPVPTPTPTDPQNNVSDIPACPPGGCPINHNNH